MHGEKLDKKSNEDFKYHIKKHFDNKSDSINFKNNQNNIINLNAPYQYIENKIFKDINGTAVLDCGCGLGQNSRKLSVLAKNVTGIDFSEKSIFVAKNISQNITNLKFLVMDMHNLEFNDESFDYIFCYKSLLYLNLDEALKEISRVLKKNGKFIIIENVSNNLAFKYYRYLKHKMFSRKYSNNLNTLNNKDLRKVTNYFEIIDRKYFDFLSLFGFFLNKLFKNKFLKVNFFLNKIDFFLLNKFNLGFLGFTVTMILKKNA